jgi:hypothetical protein
MKQMLVMMKKKILAMRRMEKEVIWGLERMVKKFNNLLNYIGLNLD